MNDRLPSETKKWEALENRLRAIFALYNFKEIRTPLVEHSDVYHRKNEFSDMVTKETYDFKDRSDRDLTLRPEGTAGIVRSYIENRLYASEDSKKYFYMGPFYRYERPQKGRYREFNQFGVEVFDSSNPSADAEVITLAYDIIGDLGLRGVSVNINSLGDETSREAYKNALISYFKPYEAELCDDCKKRIAKNPLRILDCKVDGDKDFIKKAPKPLQFLSKESANRFEMVKKYLDTSNVKYKVVDSLVRGLDYYGDTVFEIAASIEGFGNANVLGGGGAYYNLVKELGGPDTVGIGFGFGMERLLLALEISNIDISNQDTLDTFLITMGDNADIKGAQILRELRKNKISSDFAYNVSSFKAKLKQAVRSNAKYFLIFGDDEFANNVITIKNSTTTKQEIVSLAKYIEYIKENIK